MAIFRKVHVSFWKDPFVESLTPEQKFFYLYLLTNERTKQCGIYEITIKQMCYDTGYNDETIKKLLNYFVSVEKLKYSEKTREIALKNWPKYNDSHSPKVKSCIEKELKEVKDRVLIEYLYSIKPEKYSMDTPRKEEEEEEQEEDATTTAFFQMFRRAAGKHISDEELKYQVGKFQNKYPNTHPNQAGALINTWVSNIGNQPPKRKEIVV